MELLYKIGEGRIQGKRLGMSVPPLTAFEEELWPHAYQKLVLALRISLFSAAFQLLVLAAYHCFTPVSDDSGAGVELPRHLALIINFIILAALMGSVYEPIRELIAGPLRPNSGLWELASGIVLTGLAVFIEYVQHEYFHKQLGVVVVTILGRSPIVFFTCACWFSDFELSVFGLFLAFTGVYFFKLWDSREFFWTAAIITILVLAGLVLSELFKRRLTPKLLTHEAVLVFAAFVALWILAGLGFAILPEWAQYSDHGDRISLLIEDITFFVGWGLGLIVWSCLGKRHKDQHPS